MASWTHDELRRIDEIPLRSRDIYVRGPIYRAFCRTRTDDPFLTMVPPDG